MWIMLSWPCLHAGEFCMCKREILLFLRLAFTFLQKLNGQLACKEQSIPLISVSSLYEECPVKNSQMGRLNHCLAVTTAPSWPFICSHAWGSTMINSISSPPSILINSQCEEHTSNGTIYKHHRAKNKGSDQVWRYLVELLAISMVHLIQPNKIIEKLPSVPLLQTVNTKQA